MLEKMYEKFGINNRTDFSRLRPVDYPILSDLYKVIEETYEDYNAEKNPLYPRELVQEVLLVSRKLLPWPELPRMSILALVLSSARRSRSTMILLPYLFLQASVPSKYYLSRTACRGIIL